jgi:hypothetical protein
MQDDLKSASHGRQFLRRSDAATYVTDRYGFPCSRQWLFGVSQNTMKDPLQIHHTGAPGRPSSMHLVEAEYRARWHRGEAEARIGAEAKTLAEWLQNKYPDVPRLTPKSIANRLRREHRERIANARN